MIAWLLWFFGVLPVLVADGWLAASGWPVPDLTLAVCLFFALFARLSALPGLLVCAALARSILLGGDAALHVLVLGLPVAIVVPLRSVFVRHHPIWQCAAAGFLAVAVGQTGSLLAPFARDLVLDRVTFPGVLEATLLVPPATWLLRRLPPLSLLQEKGD